MTTMNIHRVDEVSIEPRTLEVGDRITPIIDLNIMYDGQELSITCFLDEGVHAAFSEMTRITTNRKAEAA